MCLCFFFLDLIMIEEPKPGVTYIIGGVKVEFPVKAYPSQISMMDKVNLFIDLK